MRFGVALSLAALVIVACKAKPEMTRDVLVPSLGLRVPLIDGFARARSIEVDNPDNGGIVLRLERTDGVAGSPRIDVVVTPKHNLALTLDTFLQENLREMSALEAQGGLRITSTQQETINIGPRRGYRVCHEYTLAGGSDAITQVAVLLVVDGRGVAVTAAGRAELFAPLAQNIDRALRGLVIEVPQMAPPKRSPPSLAEPLDLGKALER